MIGAAVLSWPLGLLAAALLTVYIVAVSGWPQVQKLRQLNYALRPYLKWLNHTWSTAWWLWLLPGRDRRLPARNRGRVYRLLALQALLVLALAILTLRLAAWADSPLLALLLALLLVLLSPLTVVCAALLLVPLEKICAHFRKRAARDWQRLMSDWTAIGVVDFPGGRLAGRVIGALLSGERPVWAAKEKDTPRVVWRFLRSGFTADQGVLLCDLDSASALSAPRIAVLCSSAAIEELRHPEEEAERPVAQCLAAMAEDGLVVANGDDPGLAPLLALCSCPVIRCGFGLHNHLWVDHVRMHGQGSDFILHADGKKWELRSPLVGQQQIIAVLMAAAVCRYGGGSLDALFAMLRFLQPEPGHLELRPAATYTLIDDSAPGSLQRMEQALDVLAVFECQGRIVVAAGPESGVADPDLAALGERIAKICRLIILVDAERSMALREGAAKAGFPMERLFLAGDAAMARLLLADFAREGDAVLVSSELLASDREPGADGTTAAERGQGERHRPAPAENEQTGGQYSDG